MKTLNFHLSSETVKHSAHPAAGACSIHVYFLFLFIFQEDGYGDGENDGKIQEDCLQKFSSRDYIMEPAIFNTLKMYAIVLSHLKSDRQFIIVYLFIIAVLVLKCFSIIH